MNLVVGATGLLGSQTVRILREANHPVRALVRGTSDPQKCARLEAFGAHLTEGDMKDPGSLLAACAGIRCVVSTASATLSRQPGDSIAAVDEKGQLALVEAAERAHVQHFVFVSFAPLQVDCALQRAKRQVEARLRQGSMPFTVLQPVCFADVWLGPALGFDPVHGKARIFGTGTQRVSWVALTDVARFAAAALDDPALMNKTVPLGGPDALSPLEVVAIFEELGAPKVALELVPESVLEAQLANAADPIQEAFAALMLTTARGYTASAHEAVQLLPGRLTTVRDYAQSMLRRSGE